LCRNGFFLPGVLREHRLCKVSTPSDTTPLWGIDLGGTKVEGVILDRRDHAHPLHRLRLETEASLGYDHVLDRIALLVERLAEVSGLQRPERIGIGTPGTTVPSTGLLKNSNTLCLNGRPFEKDLSARLGCDVLTANDANCFTLAEACLGAARGKATVFGIILGTGVGGGIVVDGRALRGLHGICGEWGHNSLRGEGTPCYCGGRGCMETVCSGPALEGFYAAKSGAPLPLREIALRATAGDRWAEATLERLREKFAEALGAVLNLLDPDAVVIGGGEGNLDQLYTPGTREAVRSHLFNDRFDTPLLRPELGDSAGVFGAALLTL